jgi:hypothetical protein
LFDFLFSFFSDIENCDTIIPRNVFLIVSVFFMSKAKGEENFGKFDSDYQKGRTKKRKDGLKVSTSVDAGGVVTPEPNSSLPDFSERNSEPGVVAANDVLVSEPVVSETALNNEVAVEMRQKPSSANAYTKIADAIDGQTLAVGADAGPGYGERLEQKKLIERSKASKKSRTADSLPLVADVNGGHVDEKKNAGGNEEELSAEKLWNEDKIAGGFGVVAEPALEIPVADETVPEVVAGGKTTDGNISKEKNGIELKEDEAQGEKVLEGEYISEGVESMQELRDRARILKVESDEARDRYLKLKNRNTSRWLAVKRALFSSRSKEPPESLVNEMEVLKSDWNYKLTSYKDAVVELAKREAMDRNLDGKERGILMAEAIRGLDIQGSVENYAAWKNASWGGREDSRFLRGIGRAKDWAEYYRKLDWKKRIAISGAVMGIGVAGVALGSVGIAGVGVAGSTIIRLLGAYGAGRGAYELLEGRANAKSVQYQEAALSHVEKLEDLAFLESRMKTYANRTQENLERMTLSNRKRVVASAALGTLLFAAGTAFAHRATLQEVAGKVSHEFSKFLEQMKIISGLEDFHSAPVSIAETPVNQVVGTVAERVADIPAGSGSSTEEMLRAAKQPISGAVEVASPVSGTGGLASEVMGAGVVDHGTAAEAAKKISETLIDTVAVPKGSNVWETVRQYVMEHGGISDRGEAEKITARIVNNFVNTSREGISLFDLSHVQPDTRLGLILNPDPESAIKLPFKLDSVEFAPVSGANTVAEIAPVVPVIEPTPVELTPLEPVNIPSMQSASELTPTESVSPPDIFEKATELTPLEPVHISEVQLAVQLESVEPTPLSEIETAPLSSEPSDAFEKYKPLAYAGLAGVGAAAVAETVRQRRRENSYKKEKEAKLQQEVREKKFMEILAQVDSLVSFPKDRWNALWEMRETYGAYSEERATDDVFEGTRKKITKVLFGSEDVPEDVLDNMFLAVAQQGLGNPENKSLEEIRTGIKNGYSVFQVIFGRTGERLPAGKISGLSVREVLRLFTERFLSGNIPEELLDSQG